MKKDPKPFRVIRHHRDGHKTETRIFAREIHDVYCVQPRCRFRGKPAQQGVCFSKLDGVDHAYLNRVEARAAKLIEETQYIFGRIQIKGEPKRKRLSDKAYIARLESTVFCAWMNSEMSMDELVKLRAEVGLMRLGRKKS